MKIENQVAPERTGWRDEGISRRHRKWGVGCPAVDIDFLLVEYGWAGPAALVEYKNERAQRLVYSNRSYRALGIVASGACIPFFECRYKSDFTSYEVTPLNGIAKNVWLPDGPAEMSEKQYVTFLYKMRSKPLPSDLDWDGGSLRSSESDE